MKSTDDTSPPSPDRRICSAGRSDCVGDMLAADTTPSALPMKMSIAAYQLFSSETSSTAACLSMPRSLLSASDISSRSSAVRGSMMVARDTSALFTLAIHSTSSGSPSRITSHRSRSSSSAAASSTRPSLPSGSTTRRRVALALIAMECWKMYDVISVRAALPSSITRTKLGHVDPANRSWITCSFTRLDPVSMPPGGRPCGPCRRLAALKVSSGAHSTGSPTASMPRRICSTSSLKAASSGASVSSTPATRGKLADSDASSSVKRMSTRAALVSTSGPATTPPDPAAFSPASSRRCSTSRRKVWKSMGASPDPVLSTSVMTERSHRADGL
mmetsp:Transcript_88787/g.236329  ORF Transcript_88787/g.236329 Transcript_88787/m.236329 type:complete len:331 (+) Transcript_88787:669-1661(+)